MKKLKSGILLFTLLLVVFTAQAQKLTGHSEMGEYTIDVNPLRGISGASYISFHNVGNDLRISTEKQSNYDLITITLKTVPILIFEAVENNKLVLKEATVNEQWPFLIDQEKAKSYVGKPYAYTVDSYKKAAEIFAELLSAVSKRELGIGEKIIWYRGLVYYGQFINKGPNGEGKLYDYETNQLYLSCDRFVAGLCQGEGEQYDVTIPTIIYQGKFVDSAREGRGKEWLKDKSVLVGNYKAGKKEGPFVQTIKETKEEYGFIAKGNYKNNKKEGVWLYKFDSGKEVQYLYEAGELGARTIIKDTPPQLTEPSNEAINMAILKPIFRSLETINEEMELLNYISEAFDRSGQTYINVSAKASRQELKPYLEQIKYFWSEAIGDSELELAKALKIAQVAKCEHTVKYIEHLQYINRDLWKKTDDLHTRTKNFIDNRKKDDDEFYFNYALDGIKPIISGIDIFIWKIKDANKKQYLCRAMEKSNNQTENKTKAKVSNGNNKTSTHTPKEVVALFLKALFENEDKVKAETFISPSFVRKIKAINSNVLLNGYATSRYELAGQSGKSVVVKLYLLQDSKRLYNELTFSLEQENGQYYIKPNIRDYDRGDYYSAWVDLERIEK
jgi:hypothetical protein